MSAHASSKARLRIEGIRSVLACAANEEAPSSRSSIRLPARTSNYRVADMPNGGEYGLKTYKPTASSAASISRPHDILQRCACTRNAGPLIRWVMLQSIHWMGGRKCSIPRLSAL